ncbi:MAG: DUF5659 domain-containing protein [bacterium]
MSEKDFATSDIVLAAYLILRGYALAGVERVSGNKAEFVFEDDSKRPAEVLKFFNRKARIEPYALVDHIKSLKAMLSC